MLAKTILKTITKYVRETSETTEYKKYLIRLIFHNIINDKEVLYKLRTDYFFSISQMLEYTRENSIDINALIHNNTINKLASYIIHFEEHKGLKFRYIIDIIEILYRKYSAKLVLSDIKKLTEVLILFVLPSIDSLNLKQTDTLKEILADRLIVASVLSLLQDICLNHKEYVYKISKVFIYPLIRYYLTH